MKIIGIVATAALLCCSVVESQIFDSQFLPPVPGANVTDTSTSSSVLPSPPDTTIPDSGTDITPDTVTTNTDGTSCYSFGTICSSDPNADTSSAYTPGFNCYA